MAVAVAAVEVFVASKAAGAVEDLDSERSAAVGVGSMVALAASLAAETLAVEAISEAVVMAAEARGVVAERAAELMGVVVSPAVYEEASRVVAVMATSMAVAAAETAAVAAVVGAVAAEAAEAIRSPLRKCPPLLLFPMQRQRARALRAFRTP